MKFLFDKKSKLDEMQTQKLLAINSRGFWGTWAALLIAIMVQAAMDVPAEQYMAEWVIFMLMCVYGLEEYLRNGIWTTFDTKPNAKTNVLWSLLAGAAITVFYLVRNSRQDWWQWKYWFGPVCAGVFTFTLTFVLLQSSSWLYYKRRGSLDKEEEDLERPENGRPET